MAKEKKNISERLKDLMVGSSITIDCEKPTRCESIRSLCYRIPQVYPTHRNRRYSCSIDYIKSKITITVSKKAK